MGTYVYDVYLVNGRTRIFDGLTATTVSEVKNVKYQAYTEQIRDYLDYARSTSGRFDLYVRSDTVLSGPLKAKVLSGRVNLLLIPGT